MESVFFSPCFFSLAGTNTFIGWSIAHPTKLSIKLRTKEVTPQTLLWGQETAFGRGGTAEECEK
jgi:hypothetical protein